MNLPLLAAGLLSLMLGLAHSIIGERMVFRGLSERLARGERPPLLSAQQVRVLRGSWHLVTIFGFALGALLIASASRDLVLDPVAVIAATMAISALYWVVATHGRHPAWIVLLLIAGLCVWGG